MMTLLLDAALSALLNVVVLAGIPFLVYAVYHKRRHGRTLGEIAARAGLRLGPARYIGYCAIVATAVVVFLALWPPPVSSSVREGSAFRAFQGLGSGPGTVAMALFYGVVKTGFAEEFLFRGLIAGSLSRRLSALRANLLQAFIFLVPHALLLVIMPQMWGILPAVFAGALFAGWVRMRSESMVGPWLIHASVNVTMALGVAIRTAA